MPKKRENYETQAEFSFRLTMRALGVVLTNDQAKIAYRVAIFSREKDGDISFKEISVIVKTVEDEYPNKI